MVDKFTSRELLRNYVKFHNEGITSGNFDKLFDLFAHNSEIKFENINFKTLKGLDTIIQAFISRPPTDKIVIKNIEFLNLNTVVSKYSWSINPNLIAGEIYLQGENNSIKKIIIKSLF